jgi:hypothetical protein
MLWSWLLGNESCDDDVFRRKSCAFGVSNTFEHYDFFFYYEIGECSYVWYIRQWRIQAGWTSDVV